MEGEFLHWCEDGHHWREWPDGRAARGASGSRRSRYEGWLSDRCPEPERGHTIYEGHGPYHRTSARPAGRFTTSAAAG